MYIKLQKPKTNENFTVNRPLISHQKVIKKINCFTKIQFFIDIYSTYKGFFLVSDKKINYLFKRFFSKLNFKNKIENIICSRMIDKNGLFSYEKTQEISSNDIVQGLPKLNSLLESSSETRNTPLLENGLNVPLTHSQNLSIIAIKNFFEKNTGPLSLFNPKYHIQENRDPEILSWFLISSKNNRLDLEKLLFYAKLKIKTFIVNSLKRIYREQGINIHKKIFESVINIMFSRILIIEPLYNPFSSDEIINLKIYLKLIKTSKFLNKLPPIGFPVIDGISKSVKGSDRLLSSMSFKDTVNDLTKRTLFGSKDWLDSTKSNLILGRRLKIGSNIQNKTDIYFSIKNLLFQNKYFNHYEM